MDQVKIGKFIAERRKSVNLTQMQLAQMLGLTDRAISKWETGKSLPDSSVMLQLCDILRITVNDLLRGEVVLMGNDQKKNDEMLIEMIKEKEEKDRRNRKSIRYRQEWPSGPRRSFQVRVSSEAWVRTPPLAF